MKNHNKITSKLKNLPQNPGVYLMKDMGKSIIYIGKASSIKKRVSSYFQKKDHDIKTKVLLKNIEDIEYIITDSEVEALILESNLIKKHKPKFNIRLKDDKRYPYIKVTLEEEYPRIIYTRNLVKNKNRFFGPFTDAKAAKQTISMVNSIFKLKTCNKKLPLRKSERPCINYQMKRCSGICTAKITREEYLSYIENAIKFLEGNINPIIEDLTREMNQHSEELNYEKAANIRDIIYDIQATTENQKINLPVGVDQDFIGVTIQGKEAILVLFEFRQGVLLGRKINIFENTEYSTNSEIIRTFILEYYERSEIPGKIIIQYKIEDKTLIENFLKNKSKKKTIISNAISNEEKSIIKMIQKNISIIIADRNAEMDYNNREKGLRELQKVLNMENLPEVIECFDISNLQGKDAVASMVQFKNGLPEKSSYRKYKIRGYDSPNDPAMIHEVISRRVQHLVNEDEELPDLIVIDGGKGQLKRGMEAASNFDVQTKIISIAKKQEEIFYDPLKKSIILPETSSALKIIQNIRDEAHRFAITYHKKLRDKKTKRSVLDEIPDMGTKTKKLLLEHFKSIDNIKKADVNELSSVKGIGKKTAEKVYDFFQGQSRSIHKPL